MTHTGTGRLADKLEWTNTAGNSAPNAGQNKAYTRFFYDGFGQMDKRDRRSETGGTRRVLDFHWDTAGRLRRVKQDTNTRFTAQYTADGERVLKTDDTTGSHVFSFGLHDTGNGGTLYTPGLAQRRGTTYSFFQSDWLGSTRYLTDATGLNAPSALRYDAFGNLSASAGAANPTDFQFAGAWGYETEGQNGLGLHYRCPAAATLPGDAAELCPLTLGNGPDAGGPGLEHRAMSVQGILWLHVQFVRCDNCLRVTQAQPTVSLARRPPFDVQQGLQEHLFNVDLDQNLVRSRRGFRCPEWMRDK